MKNTFRKILSMLHPVDPECWILMFSDEQGQFTVERFDEVCKINRTLVEQGRIAECTPMFLCGRFETQKAAFEHIPVWAKRHRLVWDESSCRWIK